MSTNEVYFLVLVCGAFGVLAVALAAATIRYHRWQRQTVDAVRQPAGRTGPRGH